MPEGTEHASPWETFIGEEAIIRIYKSFSRTKKLNRGTVYQRGPEGLEPNQYLSFVHDGYRCFRTCFCGACTGLQCCICPTSQTSSPARIGLQFSAVARMDVVAKCAVALLLCSSEA